MALQSRQYAILSAIRSTILADADLVAAVSTWRLEKLAFHRGATWSPGAYVSPLVGLEPPHENSLDQLDVRALVGIVDGTAEGDPQSGLESGLARIERVEDIFRNKGVNDAPVPLRNLSSVYSGADRFTFQYVTIEQADRFMAAALANGYDFSATIVKVSITVPRRDTRNLGA